MSPTIVNKKFTLPFAHEIEKSYETLVQCVSSWSESIRKRQMYLLGLDVHLFLVFSYHDETPELVFHILLKEPGPHFSIFSVFQAKGRFEGENCLS